MKLLVLIPRVKRLSFAFFQNSNEAELLRGEISDYRGQKCRAAIEEIFDRWRAVVDDEDFQGTIAVRIPFGGEQFRGTVALDAATITALKTMIQERPLHLPAVTKLLSILNEGYKNLPVALAFETAFFVALPARESCYAISPELIGPLRRFGQHGLYHRAACASVRAGRGERAKRASLKILSICLEPNPEIASVIGGRPVTVTSGLTPLEGLPGQTTCGELDPGLVITLQNKKKWGPERIATILTEESGLRGLAGEPVDIESLITAKRHEGSLAREVMIYRMLLACGAGIAAMGGIDHIVFSGRYSDSGNTLGAELVSRIFCSNEPKAARIGTSCFNKSLEHIVADEAALLFSSQIFAHSLKSQQ